jgi:hypothetical protein
VETGAPGSGFSIDSISDSRVDERLRLWRSGLPSPLIGRNGKDGGDGGTRKGVQPNEIKHLQTKQVPQECLRDFRFLLERQPRASAWLHADTTRFSVMLIPAPCLEHDRLPTMRATWQATGPNYGHCQSRARASTSRTLVVG